MSATVTLPLRPFKVPNFVIHERQGPDGMETLSFLLCDVSVEVLNAMVDQFRLDLHARSAEQRNPKP
jgi:hypothetical protein